MFKVLLLVVAALFVVGLAEPEAKPKADGLINPYAYHGYNHGYYPYSSAYAHHPYGQYGSHLSGYYGNHYGNGYYGNGYYRHGYLGNPGYYGHHGYQAYSGYHGYPGYYGHY